MDDSECSTYLKEILMPKLMVLKTALKWEHMNVSFLSSITPTPVRLVAGAKGAMVGLLY